MRKILALAVAALAVAPGLPSCNDSYGVMLAKQVQSRSELVGGPVAMADIGDYLLQNDQIKVNILGPHDSMGPGVFGGSIVDVDVRRDRVGYDDGQGHDRFAELFPVANLLVPFPSAVSDVSVLKDGSDGKEASIRVLGQGAFLFDALSILHTDLPILKALFPAIKTAMHFRTDYILRAGDRHVTIQTTVILDDPQDGCPPSTCPPCDDGYQLDASTGCYTCACNVGTPLTMNTQSESVLGQVLGDAAGGKNQAGMIAGDFVFFGAQTDVFGPGIGFDTDTAVHNAFYAGQNTFASPLAFDFVSAAGGDVSYAYFTKPLQAGDPPTVVNCPIFTSAATAFLAAALNCPQTPDNPTCDGLRAFTFERYLAVGEGDVGSVSDEVWKTRGTPVGHINGVVQSLNTGEPSPKAHLYVFKNPEPGRSFSTIDELAEANLRATAVHKDGKLVYSGDYGLFDQIDADVGLLSLVEDGSFQATLPPGHYVLVARTQDGMGFSQPQSFDLDAGQTQTLAPEVVTPGTVNYRVSDGAGNLLPAKVALVSLDAKGNPLEGDGLRRVYLGDSRLGNGVRAIANSATGQGMMLIEPGRYRFRASRGPEYSVFEQDFEIAAGGVARFDATVASEVDTTGWMSTDMHIHATESFDSGMALTKRLPTIVNEQVEFAVSTDHDFETDYDPVRRALFLEPYVTTTVGAETTTIEAGHFIGFPLKYDNTLVPNHGSYDPTCREGGTIVGGIRQRTADPAIDPFVILAHPRDGFFGYMYQLGVDPYTMERKTGTLESTNPVFRTADCSFDGMELINGKRFDLVRTPTVEQVVDWNRCLAAVNATTSIAELTALGAESGACNTLASGLAAPAVPGERFLVTQARNRTALAKAAAKAILTRTPEQQATIWGFAGPATPAETMCDPAMYGTKPVPAAMGGQPCTYYAGHVDDYFRYLEHGMLKTHIASSDSHDDVHEPGYPRTYFQSATDLPEGLHVADVVKSLKAGTALTTYGPYITASVAGKTFGQVAPAKAGGQVTLDLSVQTASWFGVDRIEIYVDGLLVKVINPGSKPADIVDFQEKVTLDVPVRPASALGKDSWIVVIAMGLEDQNLMGQVTRDIPYGEIQLSVVAANAFALVPVVNTVFPPIPTLPDWFPIFPYAVTNPIYLDTDGNGKYDAPLPFPDFCSQPCDPTKSGVCPSVSNPDCLAPENQCGIDVPQTCNYRIPWEGGSDTLDAEAAADGGTDGSAP